MPSHEALQEQLVQIRRHLHRYPELSGKEFETTAYIRKQLQAADIRILDIPGLKTGLIAEIGSTDGPVIALRGDIDALPVQEETGLAFESSIPGTMHACGHDFHTAALLGAAYLLKQQEQELAGSVRLIFQPAEEKAIGAQQIIATGIMKDTEVIFGLHNKPDLPVGTIGLKEGALMAAADGFRVEVRGKGTHAAVPEAGIDPIIISAHIITALQTITSRMISAQESAVISVTQLNSGQVWNVIPETAQLQGTIRTFNDQVRRQVRERFEQIVHGTASAFGGSVTVQWINGPPPVINNADWINVVKYAADSAGFQITLPAASPASEDFAFYQQQTPGVFIFVGTAGPQEWHHPAFDVDEQALSGAALLLSSIAEQALSRLTHLSQHV